MSCCEPMEFKREEINGTCPCCGEPTVNGEAFDQCGHSSVLCEECHHAPCDGSC